MTEVNDFMQFIASKDNFCLTWQNIYRNQMGAREINYRSLLQFLCRHANEATETKRAAVAGSRVGCE